MQREFYSYKVLYTSTLVQWWELLHLRLPSLWVLRFEATEAFFTRRPAVPIGVIDAGCCCVARSRGISCRALLTNGHGSEV